MLFQFAPIIPVYVLVAALMLLLSVRTWALRPARGAMAWSMTMFFCAIFAIGSCLEMAFAIPVLKLAMNRVIYLGTTGFVFFWGVFAIQYSNRGRWLSRVTVPLLAVVPVAAFLLALFAEQHQLLYRAYSFVNVNGLLTGVVVDYGSAFWVWVGYSYVVFIGSWLLLLWEAIQSHAIFRSQIWLIILASAIPMLTYVAQLFVPHSFTPFYPVAFAMILGGLIMLLAMTRYRFVDIIPVAYDQIFKSVKGGIIVIDLKGRIVGLNHAAEQILGCSEKEVLWKEMIDAFPKQRHLIRQFREVTETKTEVAMTEVGPYYELQIAPLYNYQQELAGRLIMFYDITERKQIEQKTLELSMERERVQLLQQFISHMSHDLRTPLATMKLGQYLLRKELGGQHAGRLDALDRQTERLTDMVESMLTLLQLEKDELRGLRNIDVNDLVAEVIEHHRTLAHERGTRLCFSPVRELPLVLANHDELAQAVTNLLVNAIYYAAGNDIMISTAHDQSSVILCVCDSGVGIAAEHLPHIFERFYRVDDARGTQFGGLGLGLTIAKAIVDRHAGSIDVHSRVGEGSEFSIRLPIGKAG
ncbi:MAG: PAS domain S-box protein [Anaerolineae bacterium]|nr:PAS domain S-box protein [Anaerolineae bacterium]